jgi:hypothetical protein
MSTPGTESTSGEAPEAELKLALPGRSVPAGDGVAWIVEGWRLFKMAPLMWIISLVVACVAFVLLGLLQGLGALVAFFLKVILMAGFMVGCRELERTGSFDLEDLLAGFRKNVGSLLIVGAVVLVCLFVIIFITVFFMAISIGMQVLVQDPKDLYAVLLASGLSALIGLLLMLALITPLAMAYWFAPALIVLNGLGAFAAMKASFMACLRNIVPFLVYSVLMTLLAFVAALPVFLGFLVWIPLAITSTYAAYRGIFIEKPAAPAPAPVVGTTL